MRTNDGRASDRREVTGFGSAAAYRSGRMNAPATLRGHQKRRRPKTGGVI
jgi:hypothetical protein